MIKGRCSFGFLNEALQPEWIMRDLNWKELKGHLSVEIFVQSQVDFTHSPGAQWGNDFIATKTRSLRNGHVRELKTILLVTGKVMPLYRKQSIIDLRSADP